MKPEVGIESSLLAALAHRDNYDQYNSYIDGKRLLPETQVVLKDYEKYFKKYPKSAKLDWGKFYTHFSQDWHKKDLDDNDIDYYKNCIFPVIQKANPDSIDEVIISLINTQHGDMISKAVRDGDWAIIEELIKLHRDKIAMLDHSKPDEDGESIIDLDFSVLDKSHGIPLFLPSLQENLGSLVLGQFVVVAADKNVGKSAFVISQAVHSFKHLAKTKDNRKILYLNSEGTSADVADRFFSNLYHKRYDDGFEEIFENQQKVLDEFKEQYKEFASNLVIFPMAKVNTFEKIKKKVLQYKPALTIIDICDKLAPEEDPQTLKKLYDNLRVLSGEVCPIIGTSQSGGTEYLDKETNQLKTRKWLTDNHLYGSKAGKGGSADTMIMIGKDDNDPKIRYINVTKNKRGKALKLTCECIDKFSRYIESPW